MGILAGVKTNAQFAKSDTTCCAISSKTNEVKTMIERLTLKTTTSGEVALPVDDDSLMPVYRSLGVKRTDSESTAKKQEFEQLASDIYDIIEQYTSRDFRKYSVTEELKLTYVNRVALTHYPTQVAGYTVMLDDVVINPTDYTINSKDGLLTFSAQLCGKLTVMYSTMPLAAHISLVRRASQLILRNLWTLAFGEAGGNVDSVSVAGIANVGFDSPMVLSPAVKQLLAPISVKRVS